MVLREEHARQRRGMGYRDLARSEADLSVERRRREQRSPGAQSRGWYRGGQLRAQRPQRRAIPLDSRHGGGRQGQRLYRRGRYRKADPEIQADLGRATIGALRRGARRANGGPGSFGRSSPWQVLGMAPQRERSWRQHLEEINED